jgi:hypothetical protein
MVGGDSSVAYAGTVIGATLGFSYLMNTILFANVTFVIDRIVSINTVIACVFLCLLLLGSIIFLYRPLRRELYRVKCVRKCLKLDKLKSYTIKRGRDPNGELIDEDED